MCKNKFSVAFNFFEAIKVELSDKGADFPVPEKIGKDLLFESFSISYDYFRTWLVEPDDSLEVSVLY